MESRIATSAGQRRRDKPVTPSTDKLRRPESVWRAFMSTAPISRMLVCIGSNHSLLSYRYDCARVS